MKEPKAGEPFEQYPPLAGAYIPDAILKEPALSAGARLLWGMLAEHQGMNEDCFPLEKTLAAFLGVKVRQLQNYLKELAKYMRGDPPEPFPLIEVQRAWLERERKTRNIYRLLWQPFLAVPARAHGTEGAQRANVGNMQYPAHRPGGDTECTVATRPAIPGGEDGTVQDVIPSSDAQSSERRLEENAGGEAQCSAHRSEATQGAPATPSGTNGTGRNVHGEQNHSGAAPDKGTRASIHGEQSDSAAAGAPDSGCVATLPVETAQDSTFENGPKPRFFNEIEKESLKVEEGRSSSDYEATDSATTPTVHAAPTESPAAETYSDGVPGAEFHRALSVLFRAAGKSVPTSSQSADCCVRLGRRAAAFLDWLPPKLPGVRHPGILLWLVDEFESWIGAEPPPASPVALSSPPEDQEQRLRLDYAEFREAEALRLYDTLSALVLQPLEDEKRRFLRREGRFDKMGTKERRCEVRNLILQDIERERVMPYAKWVALKHKRGTSP